MQNTAIDVFNQYPAEKFNPLIPVATITNLSPVHRVAINIVQISTHEQDGDIYVQKKGYKDVPDTLALTKKGLLKLMAAANIQIAKIEKVAPSSCSRCLDMAERTKKPSDCRSCPGREDLAFEAIVVIPDAAGGVRVFRGTREFICTEEKEKMHKKPDSKYPDKDLDAQYKQAFPFRAAITESKAILRALRAALMVKNTYTAAELRKPFAVPIVVPNADDPEVRRAMIDRMRAGSDALYGGSPASSLSLGAGQAIEEAPDYVDMDDYQAVPEPEGMPFGEPGGPLCCEDCGAEITEVRTSKGVYSAPDWVTGTKKQLGAALCFKCYKRISQAEGRNVA